MEAMTPQIIGISVTVGLAGAGAIAGVLKWSLGRNLKAMDDKITDLAAKVDELNKANASLREASVTAPECSACRRECQDRIASHQREILEWMRRQDDKADRLLLMLANRNSAGGVK
ncbi:MAG: hypothetical protein RBR52_15280 [Thiomonas sp.]|uniref:hypothetical protein n=1 Tax=Thiomonas sp. TaxID=2047785 RepID=UPI002A36D027|nr:hypothetical protein [Thiomonas sp.]MDY0331839.1 hypothetical protein [Thiomonas sp.]